MPLCSTNWCGRCGAGRSRRPHSRGSCWWAMGWDRLPRASTHQDVDAVVLTGISHFSPSDASLPSLIPANQDPQFARRSLDDDYLNHGAGVTGSQLPFRTDDPARPSAHDARRSREGDGHHRRAQDCERGTDLGSQLCDPGAGPDDGRAVRSRGLWRRIHLREPGSECGSVRRSRSAVLRGGRVPGDRRWTSGMRSTLKPPEPPGVHAGLQADDDPQLRTRRRGCWH